MSTFDVRVPPPSLAGNPIGAWNGRPAPEKRRQDPETCHCGKPALYRHPTRHNVGYCKEHKADAEKATNATKHRSER